MNDLILVFERWSLLDTRDRYNIWLLWLKWPFNIRKSNERSLSFYDKTMKKDFEFSVFLHRRNRFTILVLTSLIHCNISASYLKHNLAGWMRCSKFGSSCIKLQIQKLFLSKLRNTLLFLTPRIIDLYSLLLWNQLWFWGQNLQTYLIINLWGRYFISYVILLITMVMTEGNYLALEEPNITW